MSDELAAGVAVEIGAGVRRLVAPNPGMMTGPGTNTYLVGEREVAVIDPGPRIDAHIRRIVETAGPGTIRYIIVTHTHPDHSPAAAALAKVSGATLLGMPPPRGRAQDRTFAPDRLLADGDLLETSEFTLRAVHTPGHASNHLCYRHAALRWLFTGDHIMSGSTVVIDPPDGNMQHYLTSLEHLKTLELAALAPGHGALIEDPVAVIDGLIAHRLKREAKVVATLGRHPALTLIELTPLVYDDVDAGLHRLASRSLLAHLMKLQADKRAHCRDERWSLASEG